MAIVKTAVVIRGAKRTARGFDSDKRGEIGGGSTSENSETECADLINSSQEVREHLRHQAQLKNGTSCEAKLWYI